MPDVKISALPSATSVSDVDVLVINQGSPATTKKVTYGTLLPAVGANTGTFGSDSAVAQVTVDLKGRVTAAASVPVNASNISTGTLPVNRGGTGAATLAAGGYLKGNDASAITSQAGIPAADLTGQVAVASGGTGRSSFPTAGFVKSPGGAGQLTSSATVNLASEVTGTLPVEKGGTGATILTVSGYLKGNGTSAITSQTGVPVADITGTVGFDKGGTSATTQQAAINALAGATTSAQYLRGNGTNVVMSALQAADLTGVAPATAQPALTGDVTCSAGSTATTLAASGVSPFTYGTSSRVGSFTVNAKGIITAATQINIDPVAIGAISTTQGGTISSAGITGTALFIDCANSLYAIRTTTQIASPTLFATADLLTGTSITTNGVSLKAGAGVTFGSAGTQTVPFKPVQGSIATASITIAANTTQTYVVSVAGATLGAPAIASLSFVPAQPLAMWALCTASGQVTVYLRNINSTGVAISSGNFVYATILL